MFNQQPDFFFFFAFVVLFCCSVNSAGSYSCDTAKIDPFGNL